MQGITAANKRLQRVTGGCRELQEVTRFTGGYNGLHEGTAAYKGLQGNKRGSRGHKGLQRDTKDLKVSQCITKCNRGVKKGFRRLQGVTGG